MSNIAAMENKKYSVEVLIKAFEDGLISVYPLEEIRGFVKWSFGFVCHFSSLELSLKIKEILSDEHVKKLFGIIERLRTEEPIQYILGETEFYGLKILVNPNVLIPRPETEELVDLIIKENQNIEMKILDIGTGSGCIPIALKKNLPKATITGIDVSAKALHTAKENAAMNGFEIDFREMSILDEREVSGLPSFDIIVSNPPYITQKERPLMQKNVLNYEPHFALFVEDDDALIFYRAIVDFALMHAAKETKVYWEINEAKDEELGQLLAEKGIADYSILKDLSGRNRMLKFILRGK